mmetsp:Transcript_10487/g.48130  ORF Transcript_10487/g.48130 Transcript_10487/m.48130 type:complete len:257 (-) Transcript_10487:1989-2759(-)
MCTRRSLLGRRLLAFRLLVVLAQSGLGPAVECDCVVCEGSLWGGFWEEVLAVLVVLLLPRSLAPTHAGHDPLDDVAATRRVHGIGEPERDAGLVPRGLTGGHEIPQRFLDIHAGFVHAGVGRGAPSDGVAALRSVEGPRVAARVGSLEVLARGGNAFILDPGENVVEFGELGGRDGRVVAAEPGSVGSLRGDSPLGEVEEVLVGLDGEVPLGRTLRDPQPLSGEHELILAHHLGHVHERLGEPVGDVGEELLVRLH